MYSSECVLVCVSSHFSLKVSFRRVGCVSRGGVPVLIVQLHPVLLLPRHNGQLGGHGLEAVPGALVLWGGLVLLRKEDKEKGPQDHLYTKSGFLSSGFFIRFSNVLLHTIRMDKKLKKVVPSLSLC